MSIFDSFDDVRILVKSSPGHFIANDSLNFMIADLTDGIEGSQWADALTTSLRQKVENDGPEKMRIYLPFGIAIDETHPDKPDGVTGLYLRHRFAGPPIDQVIGEAITLSKRYSVPVQLGGYHYTGRVEITADSSLSEVKAGILSLSLQPEKEQSAAALELHHGRRPETRRHWYQKLFSPGGRE